MQLAYSSSDKTSANKVLAKRPASPCYSMLLSGRFANIRSVVCYTMFKIFILTFLIAFSKVSNAQKVTTALLKAKVDSILATRLGNGLANLKMTLNHIKCLNRDGYYDYYMKPALNRSIPRSIEYGLEYKIEYVELNYVDSFTIVLDKWMKLKEEMDLPAVPEYALENRSRDIMLSEAAISAAENWGILKGDTFLVSLVQTKTSHEIFWFVRSLKKQDLFDAKPRRTIATKSLAFVNAKTGEVLSQSQFRQH